MTINATCEEPNQAGHAGKNRSEAAPEERHTDRGHSQGYPHELFKSSSWNQGAAYRRQSRQSTDNNVALAMYSDIWHAQGLPKIWGIEEEAFRDLSYHQNI